MRMGSLMVGKCRSRSCSETSIERMGKGAILTSKELHSSYCCYPADPIELYKHKRRFSKRCLTVSAVLWERKNPREVCVVSHWSLQSLLSDAQAPPVIHFSSDVVTAVRLGEAGSFDCASSSGFKQPTQQGNVERTRRGSFSLASCAQT